VPVTELSRHDVLDTLVHLCPSRFPVDRTTRELLTDRGGELALEAHILIGPAALLALPAPGAHLGIVKAL
jgi:hypothetical protein